MDTTKLHNIAYEYVDKIENDKRIESQSEQLMLLAIVTMAIQEGLSHCVCEDELIGHEIKHHNRKPGEQN